MVNTTLDILAKLGLSADEGRVYLAALKLGEATVQELSREANVPRTSIYNFLRPMQKRKLLFAGKKKKRTVYSAVHPNQLVEIQRVRLKEIQEMLPQLLSIHTQAGEKSKVSVHTGADGIKTVLTDMLVVGEPIYAWSDYDAMSSKLGEYYFDVFPPERARRKILSQNIVVDTPKARKFAEKDAKYFRRSKLWRTQGLDAEINIYGDRVALNGYKSTEPYAVLIQNTAIAKALKAVWQQQWDSLPE